METIKQLGVAAGLAATCLSAQAEGDCFVERTRGGLEERGVSFAGEYIYEYTHVVDGGIRRDGSDRNLFVFDTEFDLEKLVGLKGGTVFAQYQHVNAERGGSADAGDIQAYTNLESDHDLDVIYELWYQQLLFNDRVRVKIGKVDANTEFNFVDAAGGFANSSAGFSPTIFTFPTYPDPSMSVNVFATLCECDSKKLVLGYGYYDGAAAVNDVRLGRRGPSTFFSDDVSDDYFQIVQLEATCEKGRLSVGAWHHNGDFETHGGAMDDSTHGFFFTAERQIAENANEGGVSAFFQYGWAEDNVSEVEQHIAVGVSTQGTFAGRPDDSAGLYISHVDLTDDVDAGFAKNETAIDLYYNCQVCEHISFQPELQYIINPSGDADVNNALVAGFRAILSF